MTIMKAILNRMFVVSSLDYDVVRKLYPSFLLDILSLYDEDVVLDPFNPLNKDYVYTLKKNTSKSRKQVAALAHHFCVCASRLYISNYSVYLTFDSIGFKILKTLI